MFRSMSMLFTVLTAVFMITRAALAIDVNAEQYILKDFQTGAVLASKAADEPVPPSSMSKLMTTYMAFEALEQGVLTLDQKLRVSERAWRRGGSSMFLEPGDLVRVEDLLRGIIIQSGNDACIVIAEHMGGSEEAFAQMMTTRAQDMGMTSANFVNATGWPDPGHVMSVADLTILAERIIRDFPQYYPLYSETSFSFNGIKQANRNPLLSGPTGADGLKTGHTEIAGYGLTASAIRGDRRLILVANGMDSTRARGRETEKLLNWGFTNFINRNLFQKGEQVGDAVVWLGDQGAVPLVIDQDVALTFSRRAWRDAKVQVVYTGPIPAPIEQGAQIATLVIEAQDFETFEAPLYAGESVGKLGFFGRLEAAARHIIWGYAD